MSDGAAPSAIDARGRTRAETRRETRIETWIETWIEAAMAAAAVEDGARPATLAAYRSDLRAAEAWLRAATPAGLGLIDADASALTAYLAAERAAGRAPSTIARRRASLRRLFRFAYAEGLRGDDPTLRLSAPRPKPAAPSVLSPQDVDALVAACAGLKPIDARRAVCLLELLYATAGRISEILALKAEALRAGGASLRVRGKGGRERLVPLSAAARAAAADWLVARDRLAADGAAGYAGSDWAFPARSASGRLSREVAWRLVKRLAAAAGLDPARVRPHAFRHAAATHLIEGGADLRAIQTLLGHADISTTEIYAHSAAERRRRLVMERHPLARARRASIETI